MAATTTTLTILLLFLLFLLFLLLPFTSPSPQIPGGLNTFFTTYSLTDPFSLNDTFPKLPKLPLSATPLSPFSLTIPITLHVTLVGPHPISADLLSSFLSSLNSTSPFHVITPFDPTHPHHLAVYSSLHVTVTVSRPSLSSALSSAVSAALDSSVASLRSTLTPIPHSVVDDSIRKDYESESSSSGGYALRLYLLDLGQQPKPYAYRYTESGGRGSMPSTCLGTVWVGKERYAWVDLGAGPVEYGPGLAGDGVVPRGEFHPMGTLHGKGTKSEKAVAADLAALVYGAYQVMAVPDLRIPVPFENTLIVWFFHVREKGMMERDDDDAYGLDWRIVEKSFRDEAENGELLLEGQTLSFKRYEVDYSECAVCSFAVARATKSYTSRFLFDNYTLIVSEYVDSKVLHRVLSDSSEEIKKLAGLKEEEDFGRVLPVFVFDLDQSTLLLLDRYHQSVAFKDMVIAIRTRNTQTVSDYSCNGRHVFTQTRELERALVGSILQSMWGVSPTHLSWSSKHNSTVVDYTWSVGHTPFGPFSEISSLSFVQKDAARRNVLLTWLNDSITSAIDVLESVNGHGGAEALLKGSKHEEFLKRWFLFKYKLDKVASALSRLDFKMSLYFLRSSDHDLYAMHSMVYHASQVLEASLVCFKDPPIPWVPGLLGLLALFVLAYVHSKRERVFKNKRKQF